MSKSAYLIKIKGRVTGVAFRYSALQKSRELPAVTGYIRNSGYDEVETLVQGETGDVEKMIVWLRHGPPLARVDDFLVSQCPVNPGLKEYKITY